ncbi:MAG TPA: glutamate-1-semialdehyde 2,1-aminomutase [Longimicrobiales bacterium]|nr:glutamate-1-semialdehyde 2,1-aminomutase [Longimicrobiales bacterium]
MSPGGTATAGSGDYRHSEQLWERAQRLMPGGVSSPVRAFRPVGGAPFFVDHALGARIWDVDGNEYIDYVLSWGALMLGHAHPAVVRAVEDRASRGTSYGAPCGAEVELAELVVTSVPSIEVVRFVNSGTEATMSAVRLARAATGRDLILKFSGCYHGHADGFLVHAGSGAATLGIPDSPGVPAAIASLTLTAPYNDIERVNALFAEHGERIAAIIVEPIVGNAGFIPPAPGFLAQLRQVADVHGALLIFDEVMTGFRVGMGGAQALYGIRPDLTTLGKVIGGGLPVGAYGGRRELMEMVAPAGPVYQAGTLSGNPLAMAAGVAQLLFIRESKPYAELEARGKRLVAGLIEQAASFGIPAWGDAIGAMWGVHFVEGPVRNLDDARAVDRAFFARFFHACLRNGVFLAPSPFEAAFLSIAHGDAEIDDTLERTRAAFREAVEQPA